MTYGYNPWSDYEDEEQALYGLAEQPMEYGAGPSMPMPPPAAYQPPPHAEMAPLNIDTGPDWSDALGAGTTLLAGLADLGFNHGRGTGQILAAGGEFAKARADQRLRGTQDALGYEEKRAQLDKSNRYNDYLYASLAHRQGTAAATDAHKTTSEGYRGREVAVKEAGSGRADDKVARETDATSEYADEFRNMLYDSGAVPRGKYDGASYEQMKADQPAAGRMWEFQHAGDKAKASRGGTIAADLGAAEATGDAAASKAAKVAEATQPYKVELAGQSAAARESATGAGARADQNASQSRYNKFRDETEKTRPMVGIAANLDKTLAKYPQDKPGLGMWDSFKSGKLASDDDLAVRGAVGNMTDLVARVRSGAAIPPKEFENIARFVDGGEGASEQQFRVAYGAFKRSLQQEMKEQSKGRETEARDVLGQYGNWALGAPPAMAGPQQAPTFRAAPGGGAATARGGQMGPVGGMSSGSTGGDVAKILVVSPGGAPGAVTQEQWEQLKTKPGWRLQ